jgi:hypothetical protein
VISVDDWDGADKHVSSMRSPPMRLCRIFPDTDTMTTPMKKLVDVCIITPCMMYLILDTAVDPWPSPEFCLLGVDW